MNLDFIYKRQSIRKYKDIRVPREDVMELIKAATYAPSPKNQQGWHFVVIENRQLINKMADIVSENHDKLANMAKDEADKALYMKLKKYYTLFKDAPVLVVVYGKPYDMIEYKLLKEGGADEETLKDILAPQSDSQAIGAAIENFLLGAAAMGYGTCYMTGPTHAKKQIEELISFSKEEYSLMAMITLGVPEEEIPKQAPRKSIEEVVTIIE